MNYHDTTAYLYVSGAAHVLYVNIFINGVCQFSPPPRVVDGFKSLTLPSMDRYYYIGVVIVMHLYLYVCICIMVQLVYACINVCSVHL